MGRHDAEFRIAFNKSICSFLQKVRPVACSSVSTFTAKCVASNSTLVVAAVSAGQIKARAGPNSLVKLLAVRPTGFRLVPSGHHSCDAKVPKALRGIPI